MSSVFREYPTKRRGLPQFWWLLALAVVLGVLAVVYRRPRLMTWDEYRQTRPSTITTASADH